MNTVRISRLLKQSTFLFSLVGFSLALVACGGNDKKNNSPSSASSSHIFVPTPVTPVGAGTWDDINVSASGTKALTFQWAESTVPSGTTYYKLLKKADGSSDAYEQVGVNFTTTSIIVPISVHLTDWVNSRYKVQACGDAGCVDSPKIISIDNAMLSAITYIKASNAEADDWFGWSVAISGDGKTLAVGAPAEDSASTGVNGDEGNNDSPHAGAVYVFTKDEAGIWQQQAYLKASNTEQPNVEPNLTLLPNDRFGYQVALSADGNTLAVSAILEDSPSTGINCYQDDIEYETSSFDSNSSSITIKNHLPTNTGAVYIFKRSETVWTQSTYVKAVDLYPETQFGLTLGISGDGKTLAVGTPLDYINYAGVYQSSSSSSAECVNYNASSFSSSSSSSMSSSSSSKSSNAFISVSNSSLTGGSNSGAVHVYTENDLGEWTQEAFIKAHDAKPDASFGSSIALSFDGSILVIGAEGDYLNSESLAQSIQNDGKTYSFRSGSAYVYSRANHITTFQQKLKPSPNLINLRFGASVAISGDGQTISVGAPGSVDPSSGIDPTINETDINNSYIDLLKEGKAKTDYGSAYIFTRSGTTWTQPHYIKASNPKAGYEFGSCTALSYDGSVLAVGSMRESSLAKGINGDQEDTSSTLSGAAYVFSLTGNTWTQKSYVKAPNSDKDDRFAHALGLDASGETLMIGAHRESSNAKGLNGNQGNDLDLTAQAFGAVYLY